MMRTFETQEDFDGAEADDFYKYFESKAFFDPFAVGDEGVRLYSVGMGVDVELGSMVDGLFQGVANAGWDAACAVIGRMLGIEPKAVDGVLRDWSDVDVQRRPATGPWTMAEFAAAIEEETTQINQPVDGTDKIG